VRGFLYSGFIYPAYHWVKRDCVNRARVELEASEWLPRGGLDELQHSKLVQLLRFAHAHVPYYRNIIDKTGFTPDVLARPEKYLEMPVLSKTVIRSHQDTLISSNLEGNSLIKNSTSGSTGTALRFFTDHHSADYRAAAVIRNQGWINIRLHDRKARLWGSPIDSKKSSDLRGRLHGLIVGDRLFSAYEMTEERMLEYAKEIGRFRPALLTAYPSALEVFSDFCKKNNVSFPSLKAILLSAETLWEYQRELFRSIFRVPVYNRYGCREVGDIAHECADNSGLHVNSERIYLEIVDETGNPCGPGEKGEILVTDLDNYGMPFIRYRMGDYGAWSDDSSCQCGRSHPKLAYVEGRTMDVVLGSNGAKIGGTFWTILLRSRAGIRKFQVIQRKPGGIDISIVPDSDLKQETLEYFTDKIKDKCGDEFQVNFRQVEDIKAGPGGKKRYIINELKQ